SDGGNGPSSRSATLPILYQASRIDVSKIPPREWLLGTTFCCKNLSGLIGAGGDGKTTIRICQYLALATGRSFTGEKVYRKGRVLLGSFEDDRAEIERRLGAAMLYHNISSNEIEDRLIYYCPKDKLATIGPWGVWQIGGLDKELRAIIAEYKVDLVAIDPIIKAHGVPESDNNAMDRVAGMLTSIAHDLNCAVDTVLHARKQ